MLLMGLSVRVCCGALKIVNFHCAGDLRGGYKGGFPRVKRVKLSRSLILPLEILRVDGDNCTSASLEGGAGVGSKGTDGVQGEGDTDTRAPLHWRLEVVGAVYNLTATLEGWHQIELKLA